MDLNYVKKLVKLLSESNVDEIEIEEDGKKVRLVKRGAPVQAAPAPAVARSVQEEALPAPAAPTPLHLVTSAASTAAAAPTAQYHEIKSPIVGTFYRSPAPDAAPFVQVGSTVEPGTVLCIVEAMKLMNEIEADTAGKIVKVMVENGQPVEYDQTLFLVEKA
jgi:acetyl-CoA carboxylase biotin carboxyl carrier protein